MVSPWWEFAVAREERAGPGYQARETSLNLLNLETGSFSLREEVNEGPCSNWTGHRRLAEMTFKLVFH